MPRSGKAATNSAAGWTPPNTKDYILTLLFMKYVSDKADSDPDSLIFVPEGGGFADMAKPQR